MFSDRSTVIPVRKFKGYSKKSNSQKYTVICLTVIGLCLVGTGIALIIVGDVYDVEDLLILGPIFLIAGVGFTIMMVVIITKPLCEKIARKNKIRCEEQEKNKGNKSKIKIVVEDNYTLPVTKTESKPYFQDYQEKLKEAEEVNRRQSPSKEELYEKSAVSEEHLMSKFLPPGAIEFENENFFSDSGSDNDSKEILKSKHQTYNIYGNGGADRFSSSRNHTPIPETVKGDAHTMDQCVISSQIASLENFNPSELPVYSDEARNSPLPNDIEELSKL